MTRRIFPGLYRGTVKNNDDSKAKQPYLGRCQVYVPQVYGQDIADKDLPWAWVNAPPWGGVLPPDKKTKKVIPIGFFGRPPIGASVWVMFEQGDPRSPVIMGGWIGKQGGKEELSVEAKADYPNEQIWHDGLDVDGQYIQFDRKNKAIKIVSQTEKISITLTRDGKITVLSDSGDVMVQSNTGKVSVQSGVADPDATVDTLQTVEIDPTQKQMTLTAKTLQLLADTILIDAGTAIRMESGGTATLSTPMSAGFERHDNRTILT